jgi:hypothetical protein
MPLLTSKLRLPPPPESVHEEENALTPNSLVSLPVIDDVKWISLLIWLKDGNISLNHYNGYNMQWKQKNIVFNKKQTIIHKTKMSKPYAINSTSN